MPLNTRYALARAAADRLTAMHLTDPGYRYVDDDDPELLRQREQDRAFFAEIRRLKAERTAGEAT